MIAPEIALGMDLGGTKLLGVAIDAAGLVVSEVRVPAPAGASDIVQTVLQVAAELEQEAGSGPLGVGMPGLVTPEGMLRFAPHLPGVIDLPLQRLLREALPGRAVLVDNDVTSATAGEAALGAARGAAEVLMVALGTGIGGGAITRGSLLRGAHGFAGEIGHIVVDPTGPPCPCGRRGCWEQFASGSALGSQGSSAARAGRASTVLQLAGGDAGAIRGEHVSRAAASGDSEAIEVLAAFGRWVALGIANLVNVLDPELVVVGGGLVEAGEIVLGPVREGYRELAPAVQVRRPVRIVGAALGERAGAVGAAVLARGLPSPA